MRRCMKAAMEPGGMESRTKKQRVEAPEHVARLQYDAEGNELPTAKPVPAAKREHVVVCKKCGVRGHMQKTCKNHSTKMHENDSDTHIRTERLPDIQEDIFISDSFATV